MKPSPFNSKSPSEILAIYQRYRANESIRILRDELGLGEMKAGLRNFVFFPEGFASNYFVLLL